jgi:hypothetical protein
MAKWNKKKDDEAVESAEEIKPMELIAEEPAPKVESVPDAKFVSEQSWIEKKIAAINASAMPEAQKDALLKEIGAIKPEVLKGQVPFSIYAKIRKIKADKHQAYLAYPKAKSVRLASLEDWDEIFKGF